MVVPEIKATSQRKKTPSSSRGDPRDKFGVGWTVDACCFVPFYWLVVSTHLKNISQIGNLPQIGVKMKNI